MFENKIRSTKLTGTLADNMFRRINGPDYDGDVSFVSTLRALLMNRMPNGAGIDLYHQTRFLNDESLNIASQACTSNAITVICCLTSLEANKATNESRFDGIAVPNGYEEIKDVRAFFSQKMMCRAFICEEIRSTIVVIADMDMKRYHLVQCIVPKLIPWYFTGSALTANERTLLHSLYGRVYTVYEQAIARMTDNEDFKARVMSATLNSMKRRSLENQKMSVETAIETCNTRIRDLNDKISDYLRDKNNYLHRLIGIETAIVKDDNEDASKELNDFLKTVNCIECVDCGDTNSIAVIVKGYLDVYDPEDYRSVARNAGSWYWNNPTTDFHADFRPQPARKKLLDSIFGVNPIFKIRTCGYYRLNLSDCMVRSSSFYDYGRAYNDCYANPHLQYHACLGSYRSVINEALGEGNLIAALSRCITSVHSVNVVEAASFAHTCRDLFTDYNRPYLEGPDGKSYTTLQAYQYLCEQEQRGE